MILIPAGNSWLSMNKLPNILMIAIYSCFLCILAKMPKLIKKCILGMATLHHFDQNLQLNLLLNYWNILHLYKLKNNLKTVILLEINFSHEFLSRYNDHWRMTIQRLSFLGSFRIYLETERLATIDEIADSLGGWFCPQKLLTIVSCCNYQKIPCSQISRQEFICHKCWIFFRFFCSILYFIMFEDELFEGLVFYSWGEYICHKY